jgi:hypothetical protein
MQKRSAQADATKRSRSSEAKYSTDDLVEDGIVALNDEDSQLACVWKVSELHVPCCGVAFTTRVIDVKCNRVVCWRNLSILYHDVIVALSSFHKSKQSQNLMIIHLINFFSIYFVHPGLLRYPGSDHEHQSVRQWYC